MIRLFSAPAERAPVSATVASRLRHHASLTLLLVAAILLPNGATASETNATPSTPHRFIGDAKIAYSEKAILPEAGDTASNEVAIKVDVAFGRSRGVPSGVVYVDFRGADMLLMASQLEWLVVSEKQIELKGSCFLDDSDGFTFLMKIERNLAAGKPRVRIKVWETENPTHVIFDNQRDDSWSAPVRPSSEVTSGNLGVS